MNNMRNYIYSRDARKRDQTIIIINNYSKTKDARLCLAMTITKIWRIQFHGVDNRLCIFTFPMLFTC